MTDKDGNLRLNEMFGRGAVQDQEMVVLDPARAIEVWGKGMKWRSFAGLNALDRLFAPERTSVLYAACPAMLISPGVALTLSMIKRPFVFATVLIYGLRLIFVFTLFFPWLMNLFSKSSTRYMAGFAALGMAIGISLVSNRIMKIISSGMEMRTELGGPDA